jgi:hypothetical protein
MSEKLKLIFMNRIIENYSYIDFQPNKIVTKIIFFPVG